MGRELRPVRWPETRRTTSTIGAVEGSIIAAIIVTQTPMNQPSPPRSVPGPASIPRIRSIVTIHVTSAAASSAATTSAGLGTWGASRMPARPDNRRSAVARGVLERRLIRAPAGQLERERGLLDPQQVRVVLGAGAIVAGDDTGDRRLALDRSTDADLDLAPGPEPAPPRRVVALDPGGSPAQRLALLPGTGK